MAIGPGGACGACASGAASGTRSASSWSTGTTNASGLAIIHHRAIHGHNASGKNRIIPRLDSDAGIDGDIHTENIPGHRVHAAGWNQSKDSGRAVKSDGTVRSISAPCEKTDNVGADVPYLKSGIVGVGVWRACLPFHVCR